MVAIVRTGYAFARMLLAAVLVTQVARLAGANQLYDFGVASADSELVPSDDVSSDEIQLSTNFVFYGMSYSYLYVSYNLT